MSVNNQVLKRGASGDSVKELQNLLNQNGATLAVDGNFGPDTQSAVVNYQRSNGLTVDGMVGNETMGALTGGGTSGSNAPAAATTTAASGGNATAPSNKQTTASSDGFTYDDFSYGDFSYGDFSYGDYQQSETVSQAYAALQQQLAAKPGEYQSSWQGQINGLIDRIMNREKFSYDVNSDALYQQYKDQYTALGKAAMQDTMGQAAAMTGGYGSSYASTAGNQAYQGYLSQLNDVIPELYGMARDQYNQEGQDMYNQYGLLADQENQDYGRWVDSYNQWAAERDNLQGIYQDERNFDYGKYTNERDFAYGTYADDRNYEYSKYVDDRNFAYGAYADDKNYAYTDYRNNIEDQKWQTAFDEGVRQYDEGFAYQKDRDAVSDSQWQTAFDEGVRQYDEGFAYQKDRDAVSDAQYNEAFDYQKYRDTVADTQYNEAFDYQKDRDAVSDSQWQAKLEEEKRQYDNSYSQWLAEYGLAADSNRRENEAWEMEKQAYEEAKAAGSSSGDNSAALEHVSSMSSAELVDTMKAYNYDEDNTGLAAFLDDCVASGRLTEAQADNYYEQYRFGNADDKYDTTVNATGGGSGNSSGRPSGLFGVNNVIK